MFVKKFVKYFDEYFVKYFVKCFVEHFVGLRVCQGAGSGGLGLWSGTRWPGSWPVRGMSGLFCWELHGFHIVLLTVAWLSCVLLTVT